MTTTFKLACGHIADGRTWPTEGKMEEERASMEMPRYKSHKEVWALKIAGIHEYADGTALITPAEEGYAPFKVEAKYMTKHEPKVGGYFVVYRDGYHSWSPASEFEDGYTRV